VLLLEASPPKGHRESERSGVPPLFATSQTLSVVDATNFEWIDARLHSTGSMNPWLETSFFGLGNLHLQS
jgi:hypothetical protein